MKHIKTHTHTHELIMYQVSKEMRQYFYFSLRVEVDTRWKCILISKYMHKHTPTQSFTHSLTHTCTTSNDQCSGLLIACAQPTTTNISSFFRCRFVCVILAIVGFSWCDSSLKVVKSELVKWLQTLTRSYRVECI